MAGFLTLLIHIGWDFPILIPILLLRLLASFSAPLALNRLLTHLERRAVPPTPDTFQPWMWAIVLFAGPTLGSLATQAYASILTRFLVRSEALLTQHLFDAALRVPLYAASVSAKDSEHSRAAEVQGGMATRMTSLLTSDVSNINEAREWLLLGQYPPAYLHLHPLFIIRIHTSCLGTRTPHTCDVLPNSSTRLGGVRWPRRHDPVATGSRVAC
jgi:ABC-type multidrug transport system fused ATPase/permease subunit